MSLNGPYATCGRCEHLDNGCCTPASEALREKGYPGITVRPDEFSSASNCPSFGWSEAANEEEREARVRADDDRRAWIGGRLTAEEVKPRRVAQWTVLA